MLKQLPFDHMLFFDIETVPEVYRFADLPEPVKELWSLKTRFLQERHEQDAEALYERAGVYAEFAKIICISTAFARRVGDSYHLRVKSFYGHDEEVVLSDFAKLITRHFSGPQWYLCGHNIKEFDIPVVARRMLINGVELPEPFDLAGRKPWEVRHLDTLELWKFGDYKHYTSLQLLSHLFAIPTPKDDIGGADVARVYWEENQLERIAAYCQKDTVAVARLMGKFKRINAIPDENIELV